MGKLEQKMTDNKRGMQIADRLQPNKKRQD
jgi:hypothetical protein